MRTHTADFETALQSFGRQVAVRITYGLVTLTNDDIKSINYSFKGDILKSTMKQLEIDSINDIPLNTQINLEIGLLVNDTIEYINYGTFIVNSSEKQEDTYSYRLTCYDKMIYAEQPYENLGVSYPITIRNYISALCTKIGLEFQNGSSTFPNYNKQLTKELYLDIDNNSLGYTYRDVLDELAQVTASIICINNNNKLEIRQLNDTNKTIDENYLKDTNVNFGEVFGPINTIIFSRSANSDKISMSYPSDLPDADKIPIEICDNQILNGLDRGDYLSDILDAMKGLSYSINDFDSIGILYLELGDIYSISVGENTYNCVLLNDEINVTQGIKETIYTDLPLTSEQEYQYMDSDDRKQSRTTLIVDKQGQQIQSVVSQIGDRSQKTTTITQDIDTIESQVQNIPVITTEQDGTSTITLENLATANIIEFRVHPTIEDIIGLITENNFLVNIGLIIDNREIVFRDINDNEKTFDLPQLYFYNSEVYDEFVYDAVEERAYKIQRVQVDNQGNKSILQTPVETEYEFKPLGLDEGNYIVYVATCPSAHIYAKGMTVNEYTKSFASNYEVDSKITQSANQIQAQVSEKVDKNEVISSINIAVQEQQGIVELKGNSVVIESDNFELDRFGNATFRGGNIILGNGSQILGDDGLKSTMLFYSNIISYAFIGGSVMLPMGFSWIGSDVIKDCLMFDFNIPNDFVVTDAYAVLFHTPVTYTGQTNTTGYSRNLKLYKSDNAENQGITIEDDFRYFVNSDTGYSEIPNAFGENGFTGSSSTGTHTISYNIKDYIVRGLNKLKIQSSEATPSADALSCRQHSGGCMAVLQITGYTNFED